MIFLMNVAVKSRTILVKDAGETYPAHLIYNFKYATIQRKI